MQLKIAPSILSADFGKLNKEISDIEAYADLIHVDVMDGHFVPNITIGAPVVKCIKTSLPLDVHLMIENPANFIDDFIEAGSDILVVHYEAVDSLRDLLNKIREAGVKTGVSIKPKTEVAGIVEILNMVDQILVMTVEPGFGGQEFMHDMIPKIIELRGRGFKGDIAVDGGIDADTAKIVKKAGANVLVAGSYIFNSSDKKEAIASLRA